MEKEWPPLKECPQYKYGMINHYLKEYDWEDDLTSDEYVYYTMDDEDEGVKFRYKPTNVKRFLHQVRTSRGYDLDVGAPYFLDSSFMISRADTREDINYVKGIIIDHINSKTKKVYTYVDTSKAVYSLNRILLLTFTAKEDTDNADEETFLAAVYAPGLYDKESYELLECFLRPAGPAPTDLPKQEPKQKCECSHKKGKNIQKHKCECCLEKEQDKKISKKNEKKEDKKISKKNEEKEDKKISKKNEKKEDKKISKKNEEKEDKKILKKNEKKEDQKISKKNDEGSRGKKGGRKKKN